MAEVEQILSRSAQSAEDRGPAGDDSTVAHALHICACVSVHDAPTWLIWDTDDGGQRWARVPDGETHPLWSGARLSAGGHAAPVQVLRWLRHDVPDPWGGGGDGTGDPEVTVVLLARFGNKPD